METMTVNGTRGGRQILEAALAELSEQVTLATDAMRGLQRCLGMDDAPQANPADDPPVNLFRKQNEEKAAPRVPKRRSTRAGMGTKEMPSAADRVYNVALTLDSPFTCEQLDKALKMERGACTYHFRHRLKEKVRCVREGRPGVPGLWEIVGRPKARTHVPGLGPEPELQTAAELEEKIETACKERDAARSAGRKALTTILQSKVEKLQKQLEALAEK